MELGEKATVRGTLVLGAIACAVVATTVFHFDGFMGPDSGARFEMLKSWHDGGGPFFLSGHGLEERINDPFIGYVAHLSRGTCTLYPPLFPLLAGILYFALGRAGLVVLPALAGLGAAWMTGRAAKSWGLRLARWVPAMLLFASPLLLYASTFWDHSIQIAVVAASTWQLLRAFKEPSRWWAIAAGATMGAGAWVHELVLAMGLCVAVALWSRPRLFGQWIAGFSLPVAGWLAFNRALYGHAFGPHLMGPLDPSSTLTFSRVLDFAALAGRATLQIAGGRGVLDWIFTGVVLAVPSAVMVKRPRLALGAVAFAALLGAWLAFDQVVDSGLFQTTPWILLAFAGDGRGRTWQDHAHQVLLRAACLFVVGVLATPILPGLNWGSRYLLTALPVFALLAFRNLELLASSWGRARVSNVAAIAYGLLGAVLLVRGACMYKGKVGYDTAHAETLSRVKTSIAATDQWWLGPELASKPHAARLYLIAYVPATEQLPSPLPADPDMVVRTAFFDTLEGGPNEFTFVGTPAAGNVMRMHATDRHYTLVESHPEADFVVSRFARTE